MGYKYNLYYKRAQILEIKMKSTYRKGNEQS